MKTSEIVRNRKDNADISGHESLWRISDKELLISLDGYHWLIKSDSPIQVIGHEPDNIHEQPDCDCWDKIENH